MAAKLTPAELAKEPVRFPAPAGEYSFETQQRTLAAADHQHFVTYAGTQTFSSNGKPIDKDND